jgi:hypothetical protein
VRCLRLTQKFKRNGSALPNISFAYCEKRATVAPSETTALRGGRSAIIDAPPSAPDPSETDREANFWCQAAFKAFLIHPSKWSSLHGLLKKPTAPAFIARIRTFSSG